jgi:radical SAM superfamily enzyme YgiQ (UPF0313 family)
MAENKKILLLTPPLRSGGKYTDGFQGTRPVLPPLGIASIAAELERRGHFVEIYDGAAGDLDSAAICAKTASFDMVGVSVITFHAKTAYDLMAGIRKANPRVPVVAGGPHISALPLEPLEKGLADFSVVGEGEYILPQIIDAYFGGRDYSGLDGAAYVVDKTVYPARGSGIIEDLDALPPPARHLLPMKKYRTSAVRTRRFPALSSVTSRGCPMRCAFCFNNLPYRKRTRFLSAAGVYGEMAELKNKHGAREVHFWDDNFLTRKDRVDELCERLKNSPLDIPFDCEGTILSFDPSVLGRLKRAGCFMVSYGIESGSQRVLDMMRKNIKIDDIKRVVRETRKLGLAARGYFLIGFPGETAEEISETINFACSLGLNDATFSILIPLPGTEIFSTALTEPGFQKNYWTERTLSEISFPKPPLIYHPVTVSEEALINFHRTAVRKFYLRPSQIIEKFFRMLSGPDAARELLKGLFSLAEK